MWNVFIQKQKKKITLHLTKNNSFYFINQRKNTRLI